jgi:hypothetical protein
MFALVTSVLALEPDELPFGAMYMNPNYSSSDLGRLDSMCFNHFIEYRNVLNDWRIDSLYNRGMQAVRGGIWHDNIAPNWHAEPQVRYAWSNYAEIDVDYPYPNEEVRMEASGGLYSDGKWVSPRNEQNRLSGISTWQNSTTMRNGVGFYTNYYFPFLTGNDRDRIVYRFDICMSIDSLAGDSLNEIVAIDTFWVGQDAYDLCQAQVVQIDTIYAYQCGPPGIIRPVSIDFQIPEDDYPLVWIKGGGCTDTVKTDTIKATEWDRVLFFLDIRTTGEREVKIDKIVISDLYGRELMAGVYDDCIVAYIEREHRPLYWQLPDDMPISMMLPALHLDSLITVHSNKTSMLINLIPIDR